MTDWVLCVWDVEGNVTVETFDWLEFGLPF